MHKVKPYSSFLICLILFLIHPILNAQSLKWAKASTGSFLLMSTVVDDTGNVYHVGSFNNTFDFDPDLATFNLTSAGAEDVFISKFNNNGKLIWAKRIGGTSLDVTRGIAFDRTGNLLIGGSFSGTTDLNPSESDSSLYSSGSGNSAVFLLKADTAGNYIWAKTFVGTSEASLTSVAVDVNNNVVVSGSFDGSFDFDPGAGENILMGNSDNYVAKLDSAGKFVWARAINGEQNSYAVLRTDRSANVIIAGHFSGSIDFDPGDNVQNYVSTGNDDCYILKLRSNGDFAWVKRFGSTGIDQLASVHIDSLDNIYTTGSFQNTVDFNPGFPINNLISVSNSDDAFILKLNSSGEYIWVKSLAGSAKERGYDITTDPAGNVYTTGFFYSTVDFNPGASTYNLTSSGYIDMFISKLTSNGAFVWAKSIGGTSKSAEYGQTVVLDAIGDLYITGIGDGITDVDPGPSTVYMDAKAFIIKLDNPIILPLSITSVKATSVDEGISISWTTAKETSTLKFDIERRFNDEGFLTIGSIKAAGETNSGNYSFIDNQIGVFSTNDIYYRIKCTDTDGAITYSAIKNVKAGSTAGTLLYPNPAANYIQITAAPFSRSNEYIIYNSNGQKVLSGKLSQEVTFTDISALNAGVFYLYSAGLSTPLKFIKQ